MALKKKMTVSKWIELDGLDGKVLTRPLDGKTEAKYNRKMGLAPDMRQEFTGKKADGTDGVKNVVRIEIDALDAYNAALWLMDRLIEEVEAKWEDGTDMRVNEDLFEAILDGGLYEEWLRAAKEHGSRRAEAAEKN